MKIIMNQNKKLIPLTLFLLTICLTLTYDSHAKKKKTYSNPRTQNMSASDREMFNALTSSQKKNIQNGKIKTGYNAWMVTLALGQPYYRSEHHPVYKDYEEVWLYTKNEITEEKSENEIIDPVTNWPSIHKRSKIKRCQKGDFFVLYDRGVVEKITKDNSGKTYGSCTIDTKEEFIPIKK